MIILCGKTQWDNFRPGSKIQYLFNVSHDFFIIPSAGNPLYTNWNAFAKILWGEWGVETRWVH